MSEVAVAFLGASVDVGGLSLNIVFGVVCAIIGASKGRSAIGWFFIGALLPCIGLIILLCMSDLNEEAATAENQRRQMRRLKERVRQEQIKTRQLEAEVHGRLDAHDLALGIDTRKITKPLDVAATVPLPGEEPMWYYDDHGHQAGPISRSALVALLNSGSIEPDTLVWRDGLADWTPIESVDELKA